MSKKESVEDKIKRMFVVSKKRLLILPFKESNMIGNLQKPAEDNDTAAPLGRVVSIGEMVKDKDSQLYVNVNEGDIVVFYKFAGASLKPVIDGKEYECVVLNPDDIVATFKGTDADMKSTFNTEGEYVTKDSLY